MILLVLALCSHVAWAEDESFGNEGQVDEEAQEAAEEEEEEEDLPIIPHPDIATTYAFPEYPTGQIQLGKEVVMLVGVTNTGDKTFNMTSITGSLNSPYDFSYYLQNFTDGVVKRPLTPGQKVTLVFTFKPKKNVEAMELQLSTVVNYEDEDKEKFATVAYNRTTEFTEAGSEEDIQALLNYLIYGGISLLLGFIVFKSMFASKPVAKAGEKSDDWLSAHASNAPKKKTVGSPRSSKSKKPASKKA